VRVSGFYTSHSVHSITSKTEGRCDRVQLQVSKEYRSLRALLPLEVEDL